MKIAINRCYGGFGISEKALMLYAKKKGFTLYSYQSDHNGKSSFYKEVESNDRPWCIHYCTKKLNLQESNEDISKEMNDNYFSQRDIERNDPVLIEVIEELGEEANGNHASIEIVNIPDDVKWEIQEYDGQEWVAEQHRTW